MPLEQELPMRNFMLNPGCGLAAGVLLLAGCSDTSTEPVLDPGGGAGDAIQAIAANSQGAEVERFPNIQFLLVYDPESQLLSAHMPSNVCTDGELNIVDVHRVRTPSPVNSVTSAIKDPDSQAAIYHVSSPSDAGLSGDINFFGFANVADFTQFCAFLEGPDLIAEGTVQSISTFSAASFHLRRTGTVQGVNGQAWHLTEIYQLNADAHDPNNPATFVELISRVSLTPAG
jgi:hypothetical protein